MVGTSIAIAFFSTWTTYGTWLPGDQRGWFKRGRGLQAPDRMREFEAVLRMNECAVTLDHQQRRLVEKLSPIIVRFGAGCCMPRTADPITSTSWSPRQADLLRFPGRRDLPALARGRQTQGDCARATDARRQERRVGSMLTASPWWRKRARSQRHKDRDPRQAALPGRPQNRPFIDEAHHASADGLSQIVTLWRERGSQLFFFTATPYRGDGRPVKLDGMRSYRRSLAEHMAEGFAPRHGDSEIVALGHPGDKVTAAQFTGEEAPPASCRR
jgi:hypothetical protein